MEDWEDWDNVDIKEVLKILPEQPRREAATFEDDEHPSPSAGEPLAAESSDPLARQAQEQPSVRIMKRAPPASSTVPTPLVSQPQPLSLQEREKLYEDSRRRIFAEARK